MRLLYLHVPTAWLAYLAFGVTALASLLWLIPRTRDTVLGPARGRVGRGRRRVHRADAHASGRSGAGPTWGTWWEWDARLTTTAILFFLYLGYLALRRTGATADERGKRCAIAALIAFADVPIVLPLGHVVADAAPAGHRLQRRAATSQINGSMAFTLVARGRRRSRCSTATSCCERFQLAQARRGPRGARAPACDRRTCPRRREVVPGMSRQLELRHRGLRRSPRCALVGYVVWVSSGLAASARALRDGTVTDTLAAPTPSRASVTGLRYAIVAVLVCLGAVVWMLVLIAAATSCSSRRCRRRCTTEHERRHPHDAHRRRGRARRASTSAPTAPTSNCTEGGVTVHVHHAGSEPAAVQGLRARGRRGPLGATRLDHVRLDAAVDQARQRLQAAEDASTRRRPSAMNRSTQMRAQLGVRPAHDRYRRCRARPGRRSRPVSRRTRRSCSTSGRRYVVGRPRGRGRRVRRDGDRAVRRTTSRSSTSPTTSRAPRPGSTRSPPRGRRSRARSCCGRCCSRSTSAVDHLAVPQAQRPTRSSRGRRSCSTRVAVLLRADAVRGQSVQGDSRRRFRSTARARTRCCRTIRWSRSTRRSSTRATWASRSRSRSRSPRSSPAASVRAGSRRCAARRSSRGASSPSASCSARGGATRCSAGAASGAGTRSRTRRCCRGSPRPRSSTR